MARIWAGAVVLLAVSCVARADDAEDKAVKFVEKLGGLVKRDEKLSGKPVVTVSLNSAKLTDADLKELAAFKSLKTLRLVNVEKLTDVGLKELAALTTITELDLTRTKVTDAGLKELAPLKNLTSLWLGETQVTDAGMKDVAALTSLTRLQLDRTKLTDVGLKELAALKKLTSLGVGLSSGTTQVTEAGMKEFLKAVPKCKFR